jgi:hypothetical protein
MGTSRDVIPFGNPHDLQNQSGWWLGTFGLFFHILGINIPTDFFSRWVETTNKKHVLGPLIQQ